MSLFDVKIINTSAINPEARGFVERTVGLVKLMMKKYLATASSGTLYWDMITYAVNKVMNYTTDPVSGLKPAEMVFGSESTGPGFLRSEAMAPPHYSVQNNKVKMEKLNSELKDMVEFATEKWTQLKMETNERLNKNRIVKKWKENDIVFVKDKEEDVDEDGCIPFFIINNSLLLFVSIKLLFCNCSSCIAVKPLSIKL